MLNNLNQSFQEHKDKCQQQKQPFDDLVLIESIVKGAGLRVRAVIMTVSTIIIGLMPIVYGSGTGSEVMSRIAVPMVGGMISATLLTLLILPVVYFIWRRSQLNDV